jgi:hypothetical protein
VNHENFFSNLIEAMLEPVDIIKGHLINEGINEQAHRMHLELQLLQKKRELAAIEEQLNNMKFMDDLKSKEQQRPNSRLKGGGLPCPSNQTAAHNRSRDNKPNN